VTSGPGSVVEGNVDPRPLPVDAWSGHAGLAAASMDEQPRGIAVELMSVSETDRPKRALVGPIGTPLTSPRESPALTASTL
jgi:hypothetical protein